MLVLLVLLSLSVYAIDYKIASMIVPLMSFFKSSEEITNDKLLTICYYFILMALFRLFMKHKYFIKFSLTYKISVEINTLIYDKVLKMTPLKGQNDQEEGEIQNLMQIDSGRIGLAIVDSVNVFTISISIIYCSYLLLSHQFYPSIAVLIVILLFIIATVLLTYQYGGLNKQLMERKDERVKLSSDVFNDIRTFKLLGWDMEFLKRVAS